VSAAAASLGFDLRDLRRVPKVDLHRHLEGAVRLSTVFELSREAGLPLPADTVEGLSAHALIREPVDDLEAALRAFALTQNAVRTYDAVRRITREAIEDLAAENTRLAELRFSPHFLCEPGGLDWDLALEAILEGRADAERDGRDVAVGFIAIFSRNYGEESGRRTVEFAVRHRERLVGFDVAGPEVGFPPRMYEELLRPLRGSGLGLTVHYGESGPPDYPREAIERLEPARLGHGLSVAWDPAVTRLAAEREVTLEMCPTSNWLTKGVASVRQHPIGRLLRSGLRVTLNTDDPGLMGIDLVHEWDVARDHLEFRAADFAAVTRNALEASFLPDEEKAEIRARHFAWCDRETGSAATSS
jgi:adenosine deaminase